MTSFFQDTPNDSNAPKTPYAAAGFSKADMIVGFAPGEGDSFLQEQMADYYQDFLNSTTDEEREAAMDGLKKTCDLCVELCVPTDK